MNTFYSDEELKKLRIKKYGKNVYISRNALIYHPEQLELGHDVRIDDFCVLSGKIVVGNYVHIAQFCALYGGTEGIYLEDFTGISCRGIVYATSNDYSGYSMTNPMIPAKYKTTDHNQRVILRKHVVVGCASVILPGVEIGEGSSVGAMSLCCRSLAPWGVYAGAPAKRLKDREKRLLELEKQFLAEQESEEESER